MALLAKTYQARSATWFFRSSWRSKKKNERRRQNGLAERPTGITQVTQGNRQNSH
jgi:hypothetical protein